MKISKHYGELMTRLAADEAERERAGVLWELLVRAAGSEGEEPGAGGLHLLDEAVTLQVIVLRMMEELGKEPLFKRSEKDVSRVNAHPVVDSLAKTQERFRTVMKELLERMDAEAGGEKRGWAEIIAPILKKAEGVLEDALEPTESEEGTPSKRNEAGRDPDMAGTL